MKLPKTLTFAGIQFTGDANGLVELASAIKKSANQVQHAINWGVHSALTLTEAPKCQRVPVESLLNALAESYPKQARKLVAFIKAEVPYLEVARLQKDAPTSFEVTFSKKLKENERYLSAELPIFSSWEATKDTTALPAKVSPARVESLVASFQKRVQAAKLLDSESKGKLDLEAEKADLIAALMDAYQSLTGGKVAATGIVLHDEHEAVKLTATEQAVESLKATEQEALKATKTVATKAKTATKTVATKAKTATKTVA